MAKTSDLAGLAALGALGYMMSKGKDGDQTKMSGTPNLPVTPDEDNTPRRQITDYMAKAPTDTSMSVRESAAEAPSTSSDVFASKAAPAARKSVPTARSAPNPDAEATMSRGTRNVSVAGAGRGVVNPASVTASDARSAESGMSRGTRATSMAGAGRGAVNPAAVTPSGPRDLEASMSRGRRTMPPGPGQDQINTVRSLQSAAGVPTSNAGRPGYDETGRRLPSSSGMPGFDEAGNPMKRGGKVVKKMASGGLTSPVSSASRRADGIASRGKTRGKIC